MPQITVVTSGGGVDPNFNPANPFGGADDATADGSSGVGSDDASADATLDGASPSDASMSGSGDAKAAEDGALADGAEDSGNSCPNYTPPPCGTTPCDLRSNTCCITLSLVGRCLPGTNAACDSDEISVHCLQACECPGDQVCCGVENEIYGIVTSECQSVAHGDLCEPNPQTNTQASAQLCKTDDECTAGQSCVSQTCVYGAVLSICGVQSQAPFDCVANPTN